MSVGRRPSAPRAAFVAERLSRHGVVVLLSPIAPYRSLRRHLRYALPRFVEVYVKCTLAVCAERDVKGLYRRALEGEIPLMRRGIRDHPASGHVSPARPYAMDGPRGVSVEGDAGCDWTSDAARC